MPYVRLLVKADPELDELGVLLAGELPEIIAPALSLPNRSIHSGHVSPREIMVEPVLDLESINGKDIEVLVFAHCYPERIATMEERKDRILNGIRNYLSNSNRDFTIAVCLMLVPMAYGETETQVKSA